MSHSVFTLEMDGFRGPLELLLDLIEQRKLHVSDVSLAQVSDDYIHYIEDRSRIPLSETAQFVLIASTLLLIKSRSLLPTIELTQEEKEDIKDLELRLRVYAEVRRGARLLRQRWGKQNYLPSHLPEKQITFAPSADSTLPNLAASLKKIVAALPTFTKAPSAQILREIRLEDIIERLAKRVESALNDSFKRVTEGVDRVEAIVNFLALLELVKRGTLTVQQHSHFSDIIMHHDEVGIPRYGE
jgi:segregation and condensation protein A